MNKLELIQMVKDRTGLNKQEATHVVKLFLGSLTEAMINGERVEIRGGFLHLPHVGVNTFQQKNT